MKLNTKTILTALFMSIALMLSACGGKSDADLQKDADAKMKANPKLSKVKVEVKEGNATLTGEVETQADQKAAETAAKVEGVKDVKSPGLQIKPAPTPPPMTMPAAANSNMGTKPGAPAANANMKK